MAFKILVLIVWCSLLGGCDGLIPYFCDKAEGHMLATHECGMDPACTITNEDLRHKYDDKLYLDRNCKGGSDANHGEIERDSNSSQ